MRFIASLAVALCVSAPALADVASEPGRIILTVTGDLPAGNVAPNSLDDVGYFTYHELEFETGFGFDQAALDALDQVTIMKPVHGTEEPVPITGPLLADVMKAAGAEGKTAFPLAMDGFSAMIEWSEIVEDGPILATRVNGEPMALGRLGPTMVMFPPTDDEEADRSHVSQEVWSVIYIGTE